MSRGNLAYICREKLRGFGLRLQMYEWIGCRILLLMTFVERDFFRQQFMAEIWRLLWRNGRYYGIAPLRSQILIVMVGIQIRGCGLLNLRGVRTYKKLVFRGDSI